MSRAHLFINDRKPCIEVKGLVVEEDYKFLQSIYPEHGFRSYFIGYCISRLAKHLKENGIHSCDTRLSRSEFATITGLLSHIVFATPTGAHEQDVRRGTRRESEEDASGTGDSGRHALLALGETEEGVRQEEVAAESVPAGHVVQENIISS